MTRLTQDQRPDKGWYSRGYLPHFDGAGAVQTVVFRLYDSMPSHLRPSIVRWEFERGFDSILDSGLGACWLREPQIADLTEQALMYFDHVRYKLTAWCIMPNHVHAMIETHPGFPLAKIVHAWKSFTANAANRLLKRQGEFWSREYFDRFVRNDRHFEQARNYIEDNPVKAGLVKAPADWRWSSARHRLEL